ncbi:hypothetical protein A2U01_0071832, partial [Trifolium medium]|nr:hypothetical protein [Trifolium medium]
PSSRAASTPEEKHKEQSYTARCAEPSRALRQHQKVKPPWHTCTARCAKNRTSCRKRDFA